MKKDTIILLPGYDGNGQKTFEKLVKLIDKKYKTIVINYPYLTDRSRQYNLDEIVNFIDKQVGEKVTLLGFSMGGFVASKYAFMFPKKINKLILVSSSTVPVLNQKLKIILSIANLLLKNKVTAYLLTKLFLISNLKGFPLPNPGKNFRPESGYSVFGSLAKIMMETKLGTVDCRKLAILFDDDKSFPAKIYNPVLKKQGFEITTFKTGGHAESNDYWEKVTKSL